MGKTLRGLYAVLYLALLYGPILLIALFSFSDSVYVALPVKSLTFRWYGELWASQGLIEALLNSIVVALSASLGATTLGTLAALAYVRHRFIGRAAFGFLIFTPLALPMVVVGVSLLSIFIMAGLGLSLFAVVTGHLLVCAPFAFGVMVSRFSGLNPDYERASADLGEPPVMTFWRVTLPLSLPGIIASLLLTFTISFDEFILSFFLSSNSPTLPVFMWSQMRFPDRLPVVLALATIVLCVSGFMVLLAQVLRGNERDG